MPRKYLIGIDLGTSSTKAAIYATDGTLLAEASEEVRLSYPAPGQVEQESDDFYATAARTVRACLSQSGIDPRQVAALACDSQMAGIGSVDEQFRPAAPFDSWLDMRCEPMIAWMEKESGERIVELTGAPVTCDHGPKMLWSKYERPHEYSRVVKFLTPSAYVAGRMAGLSGEQAYMDTTFIHFSGFSDSRACDWSAELCARFGLDREKLPRIVAPDTPIGEVSASAARDFGLAPGTLIAAGCGDTAACALGAGLVQPGMLLDIAGTASVLAATTRDFVADRANRTLINMHSVIPGLYHPLAYIAGGGLALRWFRDQFFNQERGVPMGREEQLYARMEEGAKAIPPGAEGLFFSPHLGGRVCPSAAEMRGAWLGFSWGHTQAHFYRAILESVAFEYAWYLSILQAQVQELELLEARVAGGGARSGLWNLIKASVLGLPYRRLVRPDLGSWGAALLAGKATGVYTDLAGAARELCLVEAEPVQPDALARAVYQSLTPRFSAMQASLAAYYRS